MNIEIESHEARMGLPELLRGVRAGHRYTITLRGEAAADLVPTAKNKRSDAVVAVDEMLAFMLRHRPKSGIDIKTLINEGRP